MSVQVLSSSSAASSSSSQFVTGFLVKSLDISKNLYSRTGFQSEFLENNAQIVQRISTELAGLLDSHMNTAVSVITRNTATIVANASQKREAILQKKLAFVAKAEQKKQALYEKVLSLAVVKRADELTNSLLTELEQQVASLKQAVNKKFNEKQVSSINAINAEDSLRNSQFQTLSLSDRASRLLVSLNGIGLTIASSYLEQIRHLSVVQRASGSLKGKLVNLRETRTSAESLFEVVYGTILQQHIVNPLLVQFQLGCQKTKDSVTLVIQNIKQTDLTTVQATAMDKFNTLKSASLLFFQKDRVSMVFSADFYESQKTNIQNELTLLLNELNRVKTKAIEEATNLYNLSVNEFQLKRAAKNAIAQDNNSSVPSSSTSTASKHSDEQEI